MLNEWISIEDRLPEYKDCVSFVFADGEIFKEGIWFDQSSQYWMEDGGMDYYGNCKRNVTHWMKYPEPPK